MRGLLTIIALLFFATFSLSELVILELEDGELSDKVTVSNEVTGFTGTGYVGRFESAGDTATVSITVESAGLYPLSIVYHAPFGEKTNTIMVNNKSVGDVVFKETETFTTLDINKVLLVEGKNTIGIKASWGWMYVDSFIVDVTPVEQVDVKANLIDKLVNPNSNVSARNLFKFLRSNYGKRILSGQVGQAGKVADETKGSEFYYIKSNTKELPAIWNLDFIFDNADNDWTPSPNVCEQAIEWWKKYDGHAILSAQWHWNIKGDDGVVGFYYRNTTNYDATTTFDIRKAIVEGTKEYEKIIIDIDRISGYLKKMQDVGMPVIWRPLHENDGTWFWWGAYGSAPVAKLWNIIYDRMVNHHKLNNLIWLWNGHLDENTPVDKLDMVGVDIYSNEHASHVASYNKAFEYFKGTRMVVLSENGRIPDINECIAANAWWGYFLTWNGDFIIGDTFNKLDFVKEVYSNPIVMNMDELPKFNKVDDDECWSKAMGYPCCIDSTIYLKDENGSWGYDWVKGSWCGIVDIDSCWALDHGYQCCQNSCDIYYIDEAGKWGVENGEWCGVPSHC